MKKLIIIALLSILAIGVIFAVNYSQNKAFAVGVWTPDDDLFMTNTGDYAASFVVEFYDINGELLWKEFEWRKPHQTIIYDLQGLVRNGTIEEDFQGGMILIRSNRYLIGSLKNQSGTVEMLQPVEHEEE